MVQEEHRSYDVPVPKRIGKYHLSRVLGRGGMGEVWLAEQREPGGSIRRVAVKLLPTRGKDSDLLRRLVREAQILGKMEHPNIVSLYEFSRDESSNTAYLAFEYVPGMDLSRIMSLARLSARPIAVDVVCYLARECLAGLGYAHRLTDEQGNFLEIIHRDISPSNVLCSVTGRVKLTDFGIARWRAASGATTEEFIVGKVPYMSPEQVDGLPLDQRTDLWSFGVVLYELLTGKLPFSGRTPVEKMAQILGADIPPVRRARPDAPPWLEEFTARLLTRDRDSRIQDAQQALGILVAHHNPTARDPADQLADLLASLQKEASAAPTESIAGPARRASIPRRPESFPVPGARPGPSSGEAQAYGVPKDPEQERNHGPTRTLRGAQDTEPEAVPSAPMPQGRGKGATAPRWATSDRLGTEVAVDREDMGPLAVTQFHPDQVSPNERPKDSGPVIQGGILDIDEPFVDAMGVLRQVVLSMEGLTGPREECWLRSLPPDLLGDTSALERFKSAIHGAWKLANKPGSRLARCLATTGGLLYPKSDDLDVPADYSGAAPRAYHIITEPGAVPLDRFLEDILGTHLSVAVATVSPLMDFGEAQGLTTWLQHAWRIALGLDLVTQLAWALTEWHASGSFHGALTPFSLLVLPKRRPAAPNEVRAACWKTRSCPCLSVTGTPRIIDVGLGPSLHRRFTDRIHDFGLSLKRGRLSGDLSRLSPEQVEAALQAASNPLALYAAPETLREDSPPGQADDIAFCGVLLYELLTGRYPFEAGSAYATLSRALDGNAQAPPASKWNPLVGDVLDHVVARAVSRAPATRYQSAAELALDLEDLRYEAQHVLAAR